MKTENISLVLDDNRRLTGKNLLSDQPGAIIDAFVGGIDKQHVVELWLSYAEKMLNAVGWSNEKTYSRIFEDGISIAISAPIDALYAACDLNEMAWQFTCEQLTKTDTAIQHSFADIIEQLKQAIAEEVNPPLLEVLALAKKNNVVALVDDDEFSLGYGITAQCWPINALPEKNAINWSQYKAIPLAYVTGTNGKSTSVRIMSQIIKQAGKCCGVTSTDFIRVGDEIIDYGDYSGPGGARMLLRHPKTEMAVLEVARGGMLRRGLPIDNVDAALITNVAEDHLGQYGINTVAALAKAKALVAKGLMGNEHATLVLNADDEYLVALAPELSVNKCWFSLNENNEILQQHRNTGGAVCFVRNQHIIYANQTKDKYEETVIVGVNDIPMTLNGAAQHNVHNALGAVGLAKSFNIDDQSIKLALTQFASNIDDNPGRGNQFIVNNAQVIMDFAHNVHSMEAMANTTANMLADRKYLMLSHAGDRSDNEIINLTKTALKMMPDYIVVAELEQYLRGRELGEVPKLIADTAIKFGMDANNIYFTKSPFTGAKHIVNQLKPNDLALLMVLSERDDIVKLLNDNG